MRLVAEGGSTGNATDSKPCECINECEVTSFPAAISSSLMSTKTVLAAIRNASDVPERFVAATETRHRVVPALMMQTVSLLTDALEAHRRLHRLIDTHVTVAQTSMTSKLSKLLTSLGDMVRGHIADSLDTVSLLNHVYSKHVSYLETGLLTELRDCDSLIAQVHIITVGANSTDISSTEFKRLELLRDRLGYLRKMLIDFDSILDKESRSSTHQWHYFSDRLLVGDCNTVFRLVNISLQYQIDWLDSFMQPNSTVAPHVNDVVFTNMTSFTSHMTRLSKCLRSYKEELKSFEDQMNSMARSTFNREFNYELPVMIMRNFQTGRMQLDEIADGYIANVYSKKYMAERFENVRMLVTNSADR